MSSQLICNHTLHDAFQPTFKHIGTTISYKEKTGLARIVLRAPPSTQPNA